MMDTIKLKQNIYEFTNKEYPNLKLYLDGETGYWLFVEKKYWYIFKKLKDGINKEDLENYDPSLLGILEKNHLIEGKDGEDTQTAFVNEKKFGLLILHFADGCNLNCKYCFVNAPIGKHKIMSKTIALKAIENMVNSSDNFTVEFNAGEPLLYAEFIKDVISYTKLHYPDKKIRFSIQTNGTLINGQVIKLIKEFNIRVGVSLDGPAEVHDKFRIFKDGRGSFSWTMRGIEKLRSEKIPFGVVSVITTPDDLLKAFNFFVNEGIKYVKFNILFQRTRDNKPPLRKLKLIDLARAHCSVFEKSIEHYRNKKYIFLSNIIVMLKNLILPYRPYMCLKSPCGAARNQITVDWDGNIYPCHRFTGLKKFIIGNVKEFKDFLNLPLETPYLKQLWDRHVDNIPRCKNCPWKSFCGGGCAAAVWAKFNKILVESDLCEYYRYLFNCLIWKIYEYKSIISDYINQKEV